jgi:glycosyltransferase involved in cell wall biosynthesis
MRSVILGDTKTDSVFGQFNQSIQDALLTLGHSNQILNLNDGSGAIQTFNRAIEAPEELSVATTIANNVYSGWNLLAARKFPSTLIFHDLYIWDSFHNLVEKSPFLKSPNEWFYTENRLISREDTTTWLNKTNWNVSSDNVNSVELLARLLLIGKNVVTHSMWAKERLESLISVLPEVFDTNIQIEQIQLPKFKPTYFDNAAFSSDKFRALSAFREHDGPILTVLGHVDGNRGIEDILAAQEELRKSNAILVVAGPASQNTQALFAERAHLGVHYLGQISTDVYNEVLEKASVFYNFRKFPTEAASGTLIDCLETRKPIVMNAGGCRQDFIGFENVHHVLDVSPAHIIETVEQILANQKKKAGESYRSVSLKEYGMFVAKNSLQTKTKNQMDRFDKNVRHLSTIYGF